MMKYRYILLVVFSILGFSSRAQTDINGEQSFANQTSETSEFIKTDSGYIQMLIEDVKIWNDSIVIFCDTAVLESKKVTAIGNVSIIQSDSIKIFADSVSYYTDSLHAYFYGRTSESVVMENGEQRLFTDFLFYNVNTKIAEYSNGAILQNPRSTMVSRRGTYDVNLDLANFYDKVIVQDSSFNLWADSLSYFTVLNKAVFKGPTRINYDSVEVYCEQGFYDIANEKAEFSQNAQYKKSDAIATAERMFYDGSIKEMTMEGDALYLEEKKRIEADMIIYNELTEISTLIGNAEFTGDGNYSKADKIVYDAKNESFETEGRSLVSEPPMLLQADRINFDPILNANVALGNVVWQDTSANSTILCETIYHFKGINKTKAFSNDKKSLMQNVLDGDTLYLSADTLLRQNSDDSLAQTYFHAYNDAKIFKSDFQAICDSLIYSESDSLFTLLQNPYMWSDTSQFSGDTIQIKLKKERVDQIFLKKNAFILESPNEVFFNQIKGRKITAQFALNELKNMLVEGNAQSIYYIKNEEDEYLGVSKTECSRILFIIENKELSDIKFFSKPLSKMTPMKKANHDALKLEGFFWNQNARPLTLEALFE